MDTIHQRTRIKRWTTLICWIWSCLISSLAAIIRLTLTGFAKLDSERSPVKARVMKIFHKLNIEGKEVANNAISKKHQEWEE